MGNLVYLRAKPEEISFREDLVMRILQREHLTECICCGDTKDKVDHLICPSCFLDGRLIPVKNILAERGMVFLRKVPAKSPWMPPELYNEVKKTACEIVVGFQGGKELFIRVLYHKIPEIAHYQDRVVQTAIERGISRIHGEWFRNNYLPRELWKDIYISALELYKLGEWDGRDIVNEMKHGTFFYVPWMFVRRAVNRANMDCHGVCS